MTNTWFIFIVAAIAWGSGWMYGSSGSWNEGYERGKEAMQLMLQGDPMTTEKVATVYDWDTALRPSGSPKEYDLEELTPAPFKRRLSMVEGGRYDS